MDDLRPLLFGLLAILLAYASKGLLLKPKVSLHMPMRIPGTFTSYLDAFRFLLRGEKIVQQGYQRYNGGIFRIPFLARWVFVASGPKLIQDMCYSPDDALSFEDATRDVSHLEKTVYDPRFGLKVNSKQLQADYTLGPRDVPEHTATVLGKLTRNLTRLFPDIQDEMICAFDDVLDLEGPDWKAIGVISAVTGIVARISGRLFVGLPLCRDPEYIKFSIKHTVSVGVVGQLLGYLPPFMIPILGPLISSRKKSTRQAIKLMGHLIVERIAMFEERGAAWSDKPNDLISWLVETAQPQQRTMPQIIQRMLTITMAAIHTSSFTFAGALFDLATYSEYIQPLREEVERVIGEHGWTKAALADMHKIDSFLRESQRINGFGSLQMSRKVIHPDGFTFSDGTFLPAGSLVQVPTRSVHHDPGNYPNPEVFDGLRSYNMRAAAESESESSVFNHYMVTTAPTHLAFGHGRHACPGRFFAATELKSMLAHIVLNYDVRLENEGVRPPDQLFDALRIPNQKAKVLFRKRAVEA
ncbi:cytochrome P450 [Mycena capillaripes]|nr:cytochrome P450 [Mycena capillaripes]